MLSHGFDVTKRTGSVHVAFEPLASRLIEKQSLSSIASRLRSERFEQFDHEGRDGALLQ
jgi:hypothetical protein